MDTYQPIYDAVRSRISGGNIEQAVQDAFRFANLDHYLSQAAEAVKQAAYAYERPSAVFRPTLTQDGNAWCALYGEDIQSRVAAFGSTPAEAMQAFDVAWYKKP